MPASFYLVAIDARCAPDQLPPLGDWQICPDWHWLSLHALQIRPARLQAQLTALSANAYEVLLLGLQPGEVWELSVFAAGQAYGPVRHDWHEPGHAAAEQLLTALGHLGRFESPPQELLKLLMPTTKRFLATSLLGDLPAFLQLLGLGGIFTGFEAVQREERKHQRWEAHCRQLEAEGSSDWIRRATQHLLPRAYDVPDHANAPLRPADLSLFWRLAWFADPENCPLLELSGPESEMQALQQDWPADAACDWLPSDSLQAERQSICLAWAAGELGQDLLPRVDWALGLLVPRLQVLKGDWSLSLRCAPVPRLFHETDARPDSESLQLYRFALREGQLRLSACWPALSPIDLNPALELARWARDGGNWQAPRREEALRLYRRLRQDRWLGRAALRLKGRELSLRPGSYSPYKTRHQIARQLFLTCASTAWPLEAERQRRRRLDRAWREREADPLYDGERIYRGLSGAFYEGEPEALSSATRQELARRSQDLEAQGWKALGDLVWDQAEEVLMRVFRQADGLAWGFLLAEPGGLRHELASPLDPEDANWLVTCDRPNSDDAPAALHLHCIPGADDPSLWLAHQNALPPHPIQIPPAALDDFLPILDAFLQRISAE